MDMLEQVKTIICIGSFSCWCLTLCTLHLCFAGKSYPFGVRCSLFLQCTFSGADGILRRQAN